MTTSIKLSVPMLGELKLLALDRGVSVNELLVEAAENFLQLHGRSATRDAA